MLVCHGVSSTRNIGDSSVFLSCCIMTHKGSAVPGTSVEALSGANFHSLMKESLVEVLRENPQVLQPTASDQPQPQATSRENGKLPFLYIL